jgi:hypothetical protein
MTTTTASSSAAARTSQVDVGREDGPPIASCASWRTAADAAWLVAHALQRSACACLPCRQAPEWRDSRARFPI